MSFCPRCGTSIQDGMSMCPNCGADTNTNNSNYGYDNNNMYSNGGYDNNGYGNNGYSNNGYNNNSYGNNGYADNGYGNNGYGNNSYADNGYGNNGYDNGYGNNGYADNGYSNNGYANNGYGNNGYGNNGYADNGYGNNGYNNGYDNNGYAVNNSYGSNVYANNNYANNGNGRPALQLKTNRSLVKLIFLSIITLGIYSIVVHTNISTSINTLASPYDGRKTMNYCLVFFIFSWLTLGILPLVWNHRLCGRIGRELQRRNIAYNFGSGTYWGWGFFGSLILVGPFIYGHKLCKSMNLLCDHYNNFG